MRTAITQILLFTIGALLITNAVIIWPHRQVLADLFIDSEAIARSVFSPEAIQCRRESSWLAREQRMVALRRGL